MANVLPDLYLFRRQVVRGGLRLRAGDQLGNRERESELGDEEKEQEEEQEEEKENEQEQEHWREAKEEREDSWIRYRQMG